MLRRHSEHRRLDLTETEMPEIEALREGSGAAKTKGAIKGVKEETKSGYETLKGKVTD